MLVDYDLSQPRKDSSMNERIPSVTSLYGVNHSLYGIAQNLQVVSLEDKSGG